MWKVKSGNMKARPGKRRLALRSLRESALDHAHMPINQYPPEGPVEISMFRNAEMEIVYSSKQGAIHAVH